MISFRLFYNMTYSFRIGIYFPFPFACFRSYNNPFATLFSGCFPIREVAHNIIVSPSSGIIRRLISIS